MDLNRIDFYTTNYLRKLINYYDILLKTHSVNLF